MKINIDLAVLLSYNNHREKNSGIYEWYSDIL